MPNNHHQTHENTRILLLAYYYPPQVTAGALRPARLVRYFPEFGYDPRVVTLRTNGEAAGTGAAEYVSAADGGAVLKALAKALRLTEIVTDRSHRFEWVAAAMRAAERLASAAPFEAIVSTGPPQATHLAAMLLKRRWRVPWIADFRDPITMPGAKPALEAAWLERRFFSSADAVVAVTDRVANGWREQYPEFAGKFSVIWNGFDPAEAFGPQALPAREHRVISHLGDIYGPRHPSRFIASISRLRDRDPSLRDLHIELVGPMDEDAPCRAMREFQALAAEGALRFNAAVAPRAEALHKTATSDYLLLLDINLKGVGYTVPAKIFDYVRSGRPILAYTPAESPVEEILRQSGVRHCCVHPADSPEQEDVKVAAFLAVPSTATEPNDWFRSRFDGRQQAGAMARCLDASRGAGAIETAGSAGIGGVGPQPTRSTG